MCSSICGGARHGPGWRSSGLMLDLQENGAGDAANGRRDGTLLRASNIAKAFGATQAVRDASFQLRAGEVHALVGENGCGKSTVVKILSGVHTPDAGEI